ncbi:MAG: DUF3299 domain-containing protein [Tepidisphaeraceae bacterium]|jgi:hypothetical protein
MRKQSAIIITLIVTLLGLVSIPVPSQPAKEEQTVVRMEKNANIAFDRQSYTQALALYQKLLTMLPKDSPKIKPIEEKVRVCQKALADQALANPQLLPGNSADQIATSPEERKAHVKPKDGEVYEVAIKQLGNFEFDAEKGGNIPKDVLALNGSTIRTRGFMLPLDQADHITEFALVPSLFSCCFGQPPQVQHTLVVRTPKGKAVGYFPDEILVEGTLTVKERTEDGLVVSLFEIACTSVKPAPAQKPQ